MLKSVPVGAQHPFRSVIPPVSGGKARPLWSVMIPTYNCAHYLREALSGVLAQDPGTDTMQIEVIDDHSTLDNPAAIVNELGNGRVGFFRQRENVGITRNFEKCLARSRGKLIHLLHGDDCVMDGFYRTMQRAFDENPEVGAAFCRQIYMDQDGHWQALSPLEQKESGILDNWLERLASEQRILTPSIVVRRDVYERLGGFDSRLIYSEDWEMWVRIAARYPVWYEVEPLAVYRMHSASNTGRHIRTGDDMRDTRRAIEIFKAYLPDEMAARVSRKARETYAHTALDTAYAMFARGEMGAVLAQLREALQLSRSCRVLWKLLRLTICIGRGRVPSIGRVIRKKCDE